MCHQAGYRGIGVAWSVADTQIINSAQYLLCKSCVSRLTKYRMNEYVRGKLDAFTSPTVIARAPIPPVSASSACMFTHRSALGNARYAAERKLDWRPGRVYFLTLLVPSRDDRTLALTARSASRLPP
jgi:hypothetical protein